jgi:molecular chaperone DnaK
VPQIEVTFDIDANGIVNVSAKDLATSKEQRITITSSSGLSKDEVARMVRDAESHAADDHTKQDLVQARNAGDALEHSVQTVLGQQRDALSASDRAGVETALASLNAALKGNDREAIVRATDALQRASSALGPATEASAGRGGPRGASKGHSAPHADSDVVDAEYAEVK